MAFCGVHACFGTKRTSTCALHMSAFDPTATLAVHCGNGFDAGFNPYQSTRLNRYDAPPELEGGQEAARTPRDPHTGNMPMRVWDLKGHRCAPIVGARNYSQPHSQEARVSRLVPIVIVTAIDIFYRLGDLVGVLLDIVQRGDSHCVEFTSG